MKGLDAGGNQKRVGGRGLLQTSEIEGQPQALGSDFVGGIGPAVLPFPDSKGLSRPAAEDLEIIAGVIGVVDVRGDKQDRPFQFILKMDSQQTRKRPPRPVDRQRRIDRFASAQPVNDLRNDLIFMQIHRRASDWPRWTDPQIFDNKRSIIRQNWCPRL